MLYWWLVTAILERGTTRILSYLIKFIFEVSVYLKFISIGAITNPTIFQGTQELLIFIEDAGGSLCARNSMWSMKTDSY